MPRIALVQRSPAFLDRAETTGIAVGSVREAVAGGAHDVVVAGMLRTPTLWRRFDAPDRSDD
jgi:hypothetical protein